ncbi:MAG: tyrosine-type recombinase/integrase [Clostridia bacterium]
MNKNKRTKSVGNGEGTLYYSEKLKIYVFQYYDTNNKRKTVKQHKNETNKHFKDRVTEIKNKLNNGTYIEKRTDTTKMIIENYIQQKFNDGITKGNSYKREKETLQQIIKCCDNFINKPIQKVTLNDIQIAKENIKEYSSSTINKIWRLLTKAFSIASSPSVKLITFNIMNDENLKKPISNKKTKKIEPLTQKEREKLEYVLNHEEKNHKYRNIVKMEWITGMRIGEVLARSIDDITNDNTLFIHNTLTIDENGNTILGKHTKTYNKQTGIDEGERYFPIVAELEQILNEEVSKKVTNIYKLLFWNYEKNTFITTSEINSWLRRINEKYNISKKSLHNHRLRHDRITQWKEQHMELNAIQYLAGHIEGSEITEKHYIDTSKNFAFKEYQKVV